MTFSLNKSTSLPPPPNAPVLIPFKFSVAACLFSPPLAKAWAALTVKIAFLKDFLASNLALIVGNKSGVVVLNGESSDDDGVVVDDMVVVVDKCDNQGCWSAWGAVILTFWSIVKHCFMKSLAKIYRKKVTNSN